MVILHYDFSAVVVFLVIIISMINRRVIKGHTNKCFFVLLILSLIATVADILSEFRAINIPLRMFFNYVYHFSTILIPFVYNVYVYACIGLWHYFKKTKRIWIWLIGPFVLALSIIVANLFTHCAFYINSEGVYQRGFGQLILLFCITQYLLASISIIIKWRDIISLERKVPLILLVPIMIAAVLAQQFNIGLEMTMFGLSIAELIISFTVQRVDENFDKIIHTKNMDSATDDIEKIFKTNQRTGIILIKLLHISSLRRLLGSSGYNEVLGDLTDELSSIVEHNNQGYDIYYLHDATFAVLVETTDIEILKKIGSEISIRLNNHFHIKKISVLLEARICIANLTEDFDNAESFMNFRYHFHNSLPDTPEPQILKDFLGTKDFEIKKDLDDIINKAIENGNFKLLYQPIYSVKDHRFVSAEALIRMFDDEWGMISPADFIPAAESSGAIHQIGDFVIEEVCRFLSRHDLKKLGLKYIELNLSIAQCMEPDLVDKFDKFLKQYNLSPEQLNLEITESADAHGAAIVNQNIQHLSDMGFKFSLDDYGTGYSNVKRLTEIPLEIVKLDKSFVDEMDNPKMLSAIVHSINMFHDMEKLILVEGIENREKLDKFLNLGCNYIQGYVFSKPIPEDEFVQFLRKHYSRNCLSHF